MQLSNKNNMMKLISSFKKQNPADVVSGIVNEIAQQGNPVMQNLAELIKKGDTAQIETVVRNIAKEKGITDFDGEFKAFKQMFRL